MTAYRAAEESASRAPLTGANNTTQNNLYRAGHAGRMRCDTRPEEAVAAYRAALEVRTRRARAGLDGQGATQWEFGQSLPSVAGRSQGRSYLPELPDATLGVSMRLDSQPP